MPKWLDPKAEQDYVLHEQRGLPAEQQVHFRLGILTVRQHAQVQDALRAIRREDGEQVSIVRTGTFTEAYLTHGLRGWSGPDGTPPFVAGDPECLRRLPGAWRTELADALDNLNMLGADAVKA